MSTATEPKLCPMPLRVESMPLSWLCETKGRDEVTGFRVWGERARQPIWRVSKVPDGTQFVYQLTSVQGGEWIYHSTHTFRDAAIACAEWHDGEMFNGAQFDPRAPTPPPSPR